MFRIFRSLLLRRRRRKSHQRPVPIRPLLLQLQRPMLLSILLLAAFYRSEKIFSLAEVDNRNYFSAATSSDTLTASSPWNSPLTDLLSSLQVQIRPFVCGLFSLMKKHRAGHQFMRWGPNTNPLLAVWPFHLTTVASLAVVLTRKSSFATLARKN